MEENKKPNNPKIIQQDVFDKDAFTLRDYFAAKAMQGIYSDVDGLRAMASDFSNCTRNKQEDTIQDYFAQCAYLMADAMLKEREK